MGNEKSARGNLKSRKVGGKPLTIEPSAGEQERRWPVIHGSQRTRPHRPLPTDLRLPARGLETLTTRTTLKPLKVPPRSLISPKRPLVM